MQHVAGVLVTIVGLPARILPSADGQRITLAVVYSNKFVPGFPDYLTSNPPPDARGRSVYEVLDLPAPLLRRSMAVHEAGHAVTAIRARTVTVLRTGLAPGVGQLGSDADAGFTDLEGHGSWLTAATIGAAGEQAQQHWLRENELATPDRLWATEIIAAQDRQKAITDIAPAGVAVSYDYDGIKTEADGNITAGWWSIRFEAAGIVSAAWEDILVLAEAIDQRGDLGSEDIGRLLGSPLPRRARYAGGPG